MLASGGVRMSVPRGRLFLSRCIRLIRKICGYGVGLDRKLRGMGREPYLKGEVSRFLFLGVSDMVGCARNPTHILRTNIEETFKIIM